MRYDPFAELETVYLYSLEDEYLGLGHLERPDWQPVKAALAAAGGDLVQAHTSGHIFAADIVEFVRRLNPGTVVPVNTFEPEA